MIGWLLTKSHHVICLSPMIFPFSQTRNLLNLLDLLQSSIDILITFDTMAARESSKCLQRTLLRPSLSCNYQSIVLSRRNASGQTAAATASSADVEPDSSLATPVPESIIKSYNPVARAKAHKKLPRSRFVLPNAAYSGRILW